MSSVSQASVCASQLSALLRDVTSLSSLAYIQKSGHRRPSDGEWVGEQAVGFHHGAWLSGV